jgi:hypothetical protein
MSLEKHRWLLDRLTEYGLADTVHIFGFQSGALNDNAELQPGHTETTLLYSMAN